MSKQRWEDLRQAASAYPTEALKADATRCLSYLIQTKHLDAVQVDLLLGAHRHADDAPRRGHLRGLLLRRGALRLRLCRGPVGLRLLCRGGWRLVRLRLEEGGPDDARHGTSCKTRVHRWRHSHSPRLSIDHRQEEQGGVEGRRGAATDGGTPSEVEAAATQRSASRIAKLRGQLRKAWSAGWRTARLIYRQIQTNEASVHGLHARSVCRNAQGSEAGHMARVDAAKRRVPSGPSRHRWSGPTVMLAS